MAFPSAEISIGLESAKNILDKVLNLLDLNKWSLFKKKLKSSAEKFLTHQYSKINLQLSITRQISATSINLTFNLISWIYHNSFSKFYSNNINHKRTFNLFSPSFQTNPFFLEEDFLKNWDSFEIHPNRINFANFLIWWNFPVKKNISFK